MPSLYVHALSDSPVTAWKEDDGREIESVAVEGLYAICERRTDAPPLTEAELHRQHSIVLRVADAVPAVLPARFGSVLDDRELAAVLRNRADAVRTAMDLVRGNAQMTLRVAVTPGPAAAGTPPSTGREYLQRRRDDVSPALPAPIEAALHSVRRLVIEERRRASEGGIVSVYHLVRRSDTKKYRDAMARIGVAGVATSGPWPPFAFAPELLA